MMKKIGKYSLIFILILILAIGYFYSQFHPSSNPQFGLTYSHRYAQYLGFDPKTMYLDILNDLKPKKIRLMAYWEDIEPQKGRFEYQQMDEMLVEAEKQGVEVILVVGHKQPRWPECHHPDWYNNLSPDEKNQALFTMLENSVNHFKSFPAIKAWQVENEPFFVFGADCPKLSDDLFRQELETINKLDSRPIILTDSGENGGWWIPTARFGADIFGSTMYRTVYNKNLGYYRYPLPPSYYRVKAGILNTFADVDRIIGVELQAEPWFIKSIDETSFAEQFALMNPKIFNANIEYARDVGFEDNYLWGVEWWYWLAFKHNDWGMWNAAKQLFANQ